MKKTMLYVIIFVLTNISQVSVNKLDSSFPLPSREVILENKNNNENKLLVLENINPYDVKTIFKKSHSSYSSLLSILTRNKQYTKSYLNKFNTTQWKPYRNLITCSSGLYLEEGSCVPFCIERYNAIHGSNCSVCDTTGNLCAYKYLNSCRSSSTWESLSSNHIRMQASGTDSYYCRCNSSLYIQKETCVTECDATMYVKSLDNEKLCIGCPNISSSTNSYVKNGECVSSCGSKYIYKTQSNGWKYCIPCEYNLEAITSTTCGCPTSLPLRVNNQNCYASCPTGTLKNTSSTCITCSLKIYNSVCDHCPGGYGANSEGKCVSCNSSTPFTENDYCIDYCTLPLYNENNNKLCVNNCQSHEYVYLENDRITGSCVTLSNCPASTLINHIDKYCYECPGTQVIENEVCVASCSDSINFSPDSTTNRCISNCPTGLYFYNDNCVADCPENYFKDDLTKKCVNDCSGNLINDYISWKCRDCQNDYFSYVADSNGICSPTCTSYYIGKLCLTACMDSYIYDTSTLECSACGINGPYVYQNTCYTNCPLSTKIVDTNYTCQDCSVSVPFIIDRVSCTDTCPVELGSIQPDPNCVTCPSNIEYVQDNVCSVVCDHANGYGLIPPSVMCYLCSDGLIYEHNCISQCPIGYGTHSTAIYTCEECSDLVDYNVCVTNCSQNRGYDVSKNDFLCIDCPTYVYDNKCVEECPHNFAYYSPNIECLSCNTFIYNNQCLSECPYGLASYDTYYCVSCSETDKPLIYDSYCVVDCPDGLGVTDDDNTCRTCDSDIPYLVNNNCSAHCPDSLGVVQFMKCQYCPETIPYLYDNFCYDSCPIDLYGKYKEDYLCRLCEGDYPYYYETTCYEECPDGLGISEGDFHCHECDTFSPFIHNNICVSKCPENTGTTGDSIYCKKCKSYQYLSKENICMSKCPANEYIEKPDSKNCVDTCSKEYPYIVDGVCSSTCPIQYGIRSDEDVVINIDCGTCKEGTLLYKDGYCKDEANCNTNKYYLDKENRKCVDCSTTSKRIFFLGECLDTCPENFTISGNTCKYVIPVEEESSSESNSEVSSSDSGTSTSDSSSISEIVTCESGQEKVTEKDGSEVCYSCKVLNKYIENGNCVDKCSNGANYDSTSNECLVCGSKYSQKTKDILV